MVGARAHRPPRASQGLAAWGSGSWACWQPRPRLLQERHDAGVDSGGSLPVDAGLVSKWRQKEKLKTTAVALVLCLNIGVDPPDVIKISPCARLECWVDPLSMQPAKALETIGVRREGCGGAGQLLRHSPRQAPAAAAWPAAFAQAVPDRLHAWAPCTGKNLQAQYERWQPRAKYKMHLDPTVEDVKKLVTSCRRTAKVGRQHSQPQGSDHALQLSSARALPADACRTRLQAERVLFHYNGHGVPRPTANGEVWVFNSRYTQYIPLSCYELQSWLGTPAIYVLDCSAAGLIINSFKVQPQGLVLGQGRSCPIARGLRGAHGAITALTATVQQLPARSVTKLGCPVDARRR